MVEVMDSVGLVTVAKCCAGLTQALYPGGVKLQDSQDYREKMYVAVLYPTAFHGIAFSSGELLDLIQNVDIIIQGAAFEKAVDQYTRRRNFSPPTMPRACAPTLRCTARHLPARRVTLTL